MLIIEAIDNEIRKILPKDTVVVHVNEGAGFCYLIENKSQQAPDILRKYVQVETSYPPTQKFMTRAVRPMKGTSLRATPDGSCIAFRYCVVYRYTKRQQFNRFININDPNNEMDLNISLVHKWLSDWAETLGDDDAGTHDH